MPSQPVRLYQGELTEQNNMGYRVSIVIRMEENLTEQVSNIVFYAQSTTTAISGRIDRTK